MTAPFHPPLDDGDTTRLYDGFGGDSQVEICPECGDDSLLDGECETCGYQDTDDVDDNDEDDDGA
jgi:hypothetical protein